MNIKNIAQAFADRMRTAQTVAQVAPSASASMAPATSAAPASKPASASPTASSAAPIARPAPIEIRIPTLRIPRGLGQWFLLVAALYVFQISVNTTHAFFSYMEPSIDWWTSFYVQVIFSIVERFLFAGNYNALTIGVLIADALFNAAGLFLAYVPRFWGSPVWNMIAAILGLVPDAPGDWMNGVLALVCGLALAYSGDKLFNMATGGR